MIVTLDSLKIDDSFMPSQNYTGRVLLFLDFDGVLHPFEQGFKRKQIFTQNYLIEKVLRELPNVEVVVSSNWSKTCTLNILKSKFSEDLRHRFIGSLSQHTENRSDDIRTYIHTRGEVGVPWVAVDDLAHFDDTDPVVRSPYKTGMTEGTCVALRNALSSPVEFRKFKEQQS